MAPNRESDDFYKNVFKHFPLPGLLIDRNTLEVVSFTKSLELALGYAENELRASNIADIANADGISVLRNTGCMEAFIKPRPFSCVVYGKLSMTGSVVASEFHKPALVCPLPQEPDQLLDKFPFSHHSLVDLLENAAIGVHCSVADGTCIWANKHYLGLLGYEAHEYIGQKTSSFLISDENSQALADAFARVKRGETVYNVRCKMRAKNGDTKYIIADSCAHFNPDGSFGHTKTFVRDDVDSLIEQVTHREILQRLEDIAAEKDRFIRIIFHELRTPLNVLAVNVSTLTTAACTPKAAGCSATIAELQHQMDKCLGLVDDLSFVMMFDSDNVVLPRPVQHNLRLDLQHVFQMLGIICNSDFSRKKAEYVQQTVSNCQFRMIVADDVPRTLMYDKSLLRVFFNLLSNAVKYCSRDGKVELSIAFKRTGLDSTQTLSAPDEEGVLIVTLVNSIQEPLDVVQVNKSFQKYLRMLPSNTNNKFSSDNSGFTGLDSDSEKSHYSKSVPVSELRKRRSRSTEELVSSLTSSSGLGLGLYVSYNVLQSLGGLLECSTTDDEACFWFSIRVSVAKDDSAIAVPVAVVFPSSPEAAPPVTRVVSADGVAPPSSYMKLEDMWAHVTKSEASSRHVIGLRQRVQNAKVSTTSISESVSSVQSVSGSSPATSGRITDNESGIEHSASTDALVKSSPKSISLSPTSLNKLGRILVVDDSPICRKVLIRALEANSYTTDFACDGQEACEKMSRVPCLYSVVLMDLRMPIMDGITATKLIKAMPHAGRVPVIVVTAEMGEEIRVAAMEAKADRFLNKPVVVAELMLLLQEYATKKAAESSVRHSA